MSTAWALLSSRLNPHSGAATITLPTVGGWQPQALTQWQRHPVGSVQQPRPEGNATKLALGSIPPCVGEKFGESLPHERVPVYPRW